MLSIKSAESFKFYFEYVISYLLLITGKSHLFLSLLLMYLEQ